MVVVDVVVVVVLDKVDKEDTPPDSQQIRLDYSSLMPLLSTTSQQTSTPTRELRSREAHWRQRQATVRKYEQRREARTV